MRGGHGDKKGRKTKMKKTIIVSIILVAFLVSAASGFQVTGKQTTTICPGKNSQEITITNSGDSTLFVELTTTEDQHYITQNVPFTLTENWGQKFNEYKWQRVDWLNAKYSEAIISPHTTETVGFVINVPEGITKGTFYAKLEVKDIGKKEGMIVIRPVYVSQVVAHITDEKETSQVSGFEWGVACAIAFFVGLVMLVATRKNKKV